MGEEVDERHLACQLWSGHADPAAVGLLGCGVMAGLGAAMNTGNVSRGDSVAVIGWVPVETIVHTGHGDDTKIGAEAPHLAEWIARGS